jgi:hypothetical protein
MVIDLDYSGVADEAIRKKKPPPSGRDGSFGAAMPQQGYRIT